MPSSPYTGTAITIKLPTPLDPSTLDVWGRQLNEQGFTPLVAAINSIIGYLNGDTTPVTPIVPPVVAVAAPAAGDIVSGAFTVTARLHITIAISTVAAYIGTTKIATLTNTAPGTYSTTGLDSSSFPDGVYTLTVRATDQVGNIGSDTVSITIRNTTVASDALLTDTGIALATEAGDELVFDPAIDQYMATEDGFALAGEDGTEITTETA